MAATSTSKTAPAAEVPEPRGLSAVWAEAALLTVWVWVAGWIPAMAASAAADARYDGWGLPDAAVIEPVMSPWLMAGFGVLLTGVGWLLAMRWQRYRLDGWVRAFFSVLGVAAGAWLVAAGYDSPLRYTPHLLVGAAVFGVGWWALHFMADRRGTAVAPAAAPAAPQASSTEIDAMRRMLNVSQNADVIILGLEETKAGQSWTFGPRTHDPDTGQALPELPDFNDFLTRLPRLRTHIQAHWRPRGVDFDDNDIREERGKVDRWYLHINTKHPEVETIPASRRPQGMRSWTMPVWLGLYLDGNDMWLSLLGRHMKILGMTGFGKSVIANNLVRGALTTRDARNGRRDCAVFMCATAKFAPFAFPWQRPYLDGSMPFPALTWSAGEDATEALRMWRAVYRLARHRNQQLAGEDKVEVNSDTPGVLVIWEEARHGGDTAVTINMGDGEMWGLSRLCHETMAICRSAGISVVCLTQEGLYEGIGPYGAQAQRNFSAFACTRTQNHADAVLNLTGLEGMGVDTTKLKNHTMYLQTAAEGDNARALPGKVAEVRTEGIIAPLVLTEVAPLGDVRFSDDDVAAMGEDFTHRWDRARQPIFSAICQKRGWPWRTPGAPPAPAPVAAPVAAPAAPPATPVPPAPAGPIDPALASAPEPLGEETPVRLPEDMEMELRSITDPGYAQPGVFGLPSQRSVDELDRMAAQMEAWVNEQYGPPVQTAVVEPTLAGLPHPLGQVMAAVDKIRAARAGVLPWVATAELAAEVYGLTGEEAADRETSRRLGREISALLTDLRTTTPRYYGPGKTRRGNGYEVAALELAVQEYRATHPRP